MGEKTEDMKNGAGLRDWQFSGFQFYGRLDERLITFPFLTFPPFSV